MRYRVIIISFLCATLLSSCGGGGGSTPTTTPTSTTTTSSIQTDSASATISASSGGTVSFSDGTTVDIPAGALTADTTITAEKPKAGENLGSSLTGYIELGPDTVKLQKPVTITYTYDDSKVGDETALHVVSMSSNNPEVNAGSEKHYFQDVAIQSQDTSKNTITVQMSHFSVLGYLWEEKAYLVLDIPGKYLQKGDLLYVLTNASSDVNGSWIPGHTAIYLGTTDASSKSNDETTIIESTPKDTALGINKDGVQTNTLSTFKSLSGQHIYLGARRPLTTTLTKEQRTKIAQYALDRLSAGVGYRAIGGGPLLNISDNTKISCVGLTELAYESAGVNLVAGWKELLLWPIRQFVFTKAVDDVTVKAGEDITIYLKGAIKVDSTYSAKENLYTFSAASSPENIFTDGRATLNSTLNFFTWTPKQSDIGKSYVVTFTMNAGKYGTVKQDLTINVAGDYFPEVDKASYTYAVSQTSTANPNLKPYTAIDTFSTSASPKKITETVENVSTELYLGDKDGYKTYTEEWIGGKQVATFSPYYIILPVALLEPSDAWNENFNINYTKEVQGGPLTVGITEINTVDTDYTTLNVTAGMFQKVLKVSSSQTWSIPDQTGTDDKGNPVTIKAEKTATVVNYLAPGVGLIKSTITEKEKDTITKSDGSTQTQDVTETTEKTLTSYSIP